MRIVLGILVLVTGLGGLLWWSATEVAPPLRSGLAAASDGVAASAIHDLTARVEGRDIIVSGTVDSVEERDALMAQFAAIDGRRQLRLAAVTVLPVAEPYETAIEKTADGTLSLSGTAPSRAAAQVLADLSISGADSLALASGAPDGWSDALVTGVAALGNLSAGRFALSGTTARLSGQAATPVEAEAAAMDLIDLPEGFTPDMAVDVADAGVVDFEVMYSADLGLAAYGTFPETLSPEDAAEALGFDAVSGATDTTFSPAADIRGQLGRMREVLPDLEEFALRYRDGNIAVDAIAAPGLDPDFVEASLLVALGEADILVNEASAPEDWVTRRNAATNEDEMASSGFWLPAYDFPVSVKACEDEVDQVMAGRNIEFLPGSADLDYSAAALLTDLAGILLHCTRPAKMRVTIGGHTDADGDEDANLQLSVARANTVREALISRGVPPGHMTAQGYGETDPVADNDTPEGRAANRRTTFEWTEQG